MKPPRASSGEFKFKIPAVNSFIKKTHLKAIINAAIIKAMAHTKNNKSRTKYFIISTVFIIFINFYLQKPCKNQFVLNL